MKQRRYLIIFSIIFFFLFTLYSYSVAKEMWQSFDFDTTVKMQDRLPTRFDQYLSYLSLLGSVEVTMAIVLILSFLKFIKLQLFAVIGWLMIIPALVIEVIGKTMIIHPAPPVFLHRTSVVTHLPSFYVHTEFSYPSGHMMRTAFLITVFLTLTLFSSISERIKMLIALGLSSIGILMAFSRVSLGEHWASDVIGGGLLGISTGLFAAALIVSKKTPALPLQESAT